MAEEEGAAFEAAPAMVVVVVAVAVLLGAPKENNEVLVVLGAPQENNGAGDEEKPGKSFRAAPGAAGRGLLGILLRRSSSVSGHI